MIGVFFSCFSSVQSIPPEWNSATWPNQTALTAEQPLTWWHRSTPSKAGEQDEGCLYCSSSEDLPWGALAAGQAVAAPSRAQGPITAAKLLPPACCSQDLLPPRHQHKGALTSSLPLTRVMFQSSRGFSCGKKVSTIPSQKVSQWSCELLFESDHVWRHIFPQNCQLAPNSLPWLHSEVFILIPNYSSQHFYCHQ